MFRYDYYTPLHVSSTILLIFRRTVVLVQHLVLSLSLGDCSVHRLQEGCVLCTEQSPKVSDDTRCCTNTTVSLKMSTIVLETCKECNKRIKIKNYVHQVGKKRLSAFYKVLEIQGGSNMTGTDLCVNLATSVPVIFEPPCMLITIWATCFDSHRVIFNLKKTRCESKHLAYIVINIF